MPHQEKTTHQPLAGNSNHFTEDAKWLRRIDLQDNLKSNVRVYEADAIDMLFQRSQPGALIHQANCRHVMGGGIAAAIKKRIPEAFEADRNFVPPIGAARLGLYSEATVGERDSTIMVINMYSQFLPDSKRRATDYSVFVDTLTEIREHILEPRGQTAIMPYGIGCGLAGGDWLVVHRLILEAMCGHPCILCKL